MFSDQVTAALADYGMERVTVRGIPETKLTAIRITDQPYRDPALVRMIAFDIIAPLGVSINQTATNAMFEGDDEIGAVIIVGGAAQA